MNPPKKKSWFGVCVCVEAMRGVGVVKCDWWVGGKGGGGEDHKHNLSIFPAEHVHVPEVEASTCLTSVSTGL